MTTPLTVTLSGAAGQIGYALLFRIASGEVFGHDVPVRIRMLEIPAGLAVAEGVALELQDAGSPVIVDVDVTTDLARGFDGANVALLVGARPRSAGMERSDLLEANGAIFSGQGRAINEHAASDVQVLVVGNPANTNAMIASVHAPDVPASRFSALTRLDHQRALGQLSLRTGVPTGRIRRVAIWGNHSKTQYPDLRHALVDDRPALELVDRDWAEGEYISTVAERGSAIIAARGASSVGSSSGAVVVHEQFRRFGVPEGDWTSVALVSDGSYGVPEGLVSSYPVTSEGGAWSIVQGLEIDAFSRAKIDASVAELIDEREAVRALGVI